MDRDERWLSWDLEFFNTQLEEEDFFAFLRAGYEADRDREEAEESAYQQWLNRRNNRHGRPTKRELHPVRYSCWHEYRRDYKIYGRRFREEILQREMTRDMGCQFDDLLDDSLIYFPSLSEQLEQDNRHFVAHSEDYDIESDDEGWDGPFDEELSDDAYDDDAMYDDDGYLELTSI